MDRADTYGYDPEADQDYFRRFDLSPVDPAAVRGRLDAGHSLEVADLPLSLGRQLVPEPETGTALYRLVQLFGTPNVPGTEAGEPDQRERYRSTWTYLFDVTYDPRPEEGDGDGDDGDGNPAVPESLLLAVYDYETDVSVGITGWHDDGAGVVREPVAADETTAPPTVPDEFAETLVTLGLSIIEEPVPATYEDVWV